MLASFELLRLECGTGYGGLVRICDDQMFRERGLISESIRPSQPSPPSSTAANTGTES